MLIGTHTLLPVCLALAADSLSLAGGRGHLFPRWGIVAVGVCGALPDLCSPHVSLEDRLASWSHTAAFLAAMAPLSLLVASFFPSGRRLMLAIACWLAVLLHLAGDAVAGGIAWLHPWRTEVLGGPYIPAVDWLWYDIGFVLLTWVLVRLRPHAEARGMAAGLLPSKPDTQS
jgi:hypothetical protein